MADTNLPKHREISQQLLAEIGVGKYAAGQLPTELQLVQRFRVSRPTVARALRDLQEQGLIERRAGAGTFLRHTAAKPGALRQFALLVPGLATTEVFEVICGELASLARAHDFTLLWGTSSLAPGAQAMDSDNALQLCAQFIEQQVKGVFFVPFDPTGQLEGVNRRIVDQLGKAGIPVVLLDRDLEPFPKRSHFDVVSVDNLAGGCLLAEHLLKLGCQRIAFIARPHAAPTINARIAGVREALTARRMELQPDWVQWGEPEDTKFVQSLMAGRRWDAAICGNDLTAAQLLRTLEKIKVRVPRDLRLVGFDDAKYATLIGVALTTIRQPCREIAITAFRAMLERTADPTLPPRSLLLSPQLVVRESCGAYLPREKRKG